MALGPDSLDPVGEARLLGRRTGARPNDVEASGLKSSSVDHSTGTHSIARCSNGKPRDIVTDEAAARVEIAERQDIASIADTNTPARR